MPQLHKKTTFIVEIFVIIIRGKNKEFFYEKKKKKLIEPSKFWFKKTSFLRQRLAI